MRKKNLAQNSEEENEFEVDEPEEIQNNASEDDWTPDKSTSGGRRTSSRLRNIPKSRAPIVDASSTEEESDGESSTKRKRGRGRPPAKKLKVSSTSVSPATTPKKTNTLSRTQSSDSEPTSTTTTVVTNNSNNNSSSTPPLIKVSKDFTSGAFILLKTDLEKESEEEPPLWKIDGKALLQKYIPFEMDGKTLYKNTSVYSGWTINNKDNYYPVSVIFKQQTRKEHIVEFKKDQIKKLQNAEEVSSSVSEGPATPKTAKPKTPAPNTTERPVIKVKSFATLPEEEARTPGRPLVDTLNTTPRDGTPLFVKVDKDFSSGAFLVLRTEASNVDPPLWKIDGKSLLQKYSSFTQDGQTLYKNTAEYSGWTLNSKSQYFPVSVVFKQQNNKEHIVQLQKIKWDVPEEANTGC